MILTICQSLLQWQVNQTEDRLEKIETQHTYVRDKMRDLLMMAGVDDPVSTILLIEQIVGHRDFPFRTTLICIVYRRIG